MAAAGHTAAVARALCGRALEDDQCFIFLEELVDVLERPAVWRLPSQELFETLGVLCALGEDAEANSRSTPLCSNLVMLAVRE
jgi:hypothetical protein